MTTRRPIATTPAPDRRRRRSGHDTTTPARERDHEQADARWLYAWSYNALRPTGELLAARLSAPAVLRPGKVGRTRRRRTSPVGLSVVPAVTDSPQ